MTPGSDGESVFVEAPARLHFGVLDLRGSLGRWFGGIGAAAPEPTLLLSAAPAAHLDIAGDDADRATAFARRFLAHHGVSGGAKICVHGASRISGAAEAEAFAALPPPPDREVERVAHLVLMALLPALADADLATFGGALTAIQEITGRWFAPVQGGVFAPGPGAELIRRM